VTAPAVVQIPRRQHTVSKVVLKRFAAQSSNAANRLITVLDRDRGTVDRVAPGHPVFKIDMFDAHDPRGAEARWQPIESKLNDAYRAVEDRTILGKPELLELLSDLMALHWVRSPALRLASDRVTREVVSASMEAMAHYPEMLGILHRRRTGLEPAGPEALRVENARLHALRPGVREQMFSESLARHFETARQRFRQSHIQIGYVPAGGHDLVIGDAPVILVDTLERGYGPHHGVAIGDANDVFMPISPTAMLALGPEPGAVDLPDEFVLQYNAYQIQSFVHWLAAKPGGPSDRLMRRALPALFRRIH
jgi:Protein of unknown function (DUF4238)